MDMLPQGDGPHKKPWHLQRVHVTDCPCPICKQCSHEDVQVSKVTPMAVQCRKCGRVRNTWIGRAK